MYVMHLSTNLIMTTKSRSGVALPIKAGGEAPESALVGVAEGGVGADRETISQHLSCLAGRWRLKFCSVAAVS